MRNEQIWVEPVGTVIVARVRGKPTAEVLQECERRVLDLARDTQQVRVLYDALELEPPEMATGSSTTISLQLSIGWRTRQLTEGEAAHSRE